MTSESLKSPQSFDASPPFAVSGGGSATIAEEESSHGYLTPELGDISPMSDEPSEYEE